MDKKDSVVRQEKQCAFGKKCNKKVNDCIHIHPDEPGFAEALVCKGFKPKTTAPPVLAASVSGAPSASRADLFAFFGDESTAQLLKAARPIGFNQ